MTPEDWAKQIAELMAKLNDNERERFVHELAKTWCLLCGARAKCYCDPAYDE